MKLLQGLSEEERDLLKMPPLHRTVSISWKKQEGNKDTLFGKNSGRCLGQELMQG